MLPTRDLLLTGQAIGDLIENEAMGAVVGPAGLGKTFAIEHALATAHEPVVSLDVRGEADDAAGRRSPAART